MIAKLGVVPPSVQTTRHVLGNKLLNVSVLPVVTEAAVATSPGYIVIPTLVETVREAVAAPGMS